MSVVMISVISLAAIVAFYISNVAKSTRSILDRIAWSILVTAMYCGPLLILLLLTICVVLEGCLMNVVVDIKPYLWYPVHKLQAVIADVFPLVVGFPMDPTIISTGGIAPYTSAKREKGILSILSILKVFEHSVLV
jgi:uncharacterized membrane protein